MRFRTPSLFNPGAVGRPVQHWAAIAGWCALILPLPAVIWRLLMLAGVPTGFAYPELYRSSAAGVGYVLGLELVQVAVAVLAFGLIRPWGEVAPRWLPGIGGRRIHRLVPTALGALGTVCLIGILGALLLQFGRVAAGQVDGWLPTDGMSGPQRAVLLLCYVPFFAWPIPIGIAVIGYWLRREPVQD